MSPLVNPQHSFDELVMGLQDMGEVQLGKHSGVVLNKQDYFPEQ